MKTPLRRYGGVGGVFLFKLKALTDRPMVKSMLALFTSSLFGRIMGTVYRVALVRAAGQDAVGLIQLALPVYRIARSVATMGLPVAVAKLTAERSELQRKPDLTVYHMAAALMLRASLLAFAVQALFSRFFAAVVLADVRTEMAIVILAILLIPIAATSALRGVVQGLQRQDFMAGSDIAEVAVRIPVTLCLVALALPYGPAYLAGAVAAGFLVGELGCFFVMRTGLRKAVEGYGRGRRHRPAMACPPLRVRTLLGLGVPVMLTGLLNNAMSLITVALIPRLLQKTGLTIEEATRAYGRLSGMAVPTLYMPMVLILPVTQTMLPEITRLAAQNEAGSIAKLKRLLRKVYPLIAIGATGLLNQHVAPGQRAEAMATFEGSAALALAGGSLFAGLGTDRLGLAALPFISLILAIVGAAITLLRVRKLTRLAGKAVERYSATHRSESWFPRDQES
jgi:stage V sporulation protein B